MQELNIVLTVLPVGPRGSASLVENGRRTFAVQIAAGFAAAPAPEELDGLWPWVLQVVANDKVELRAWLVDSAGMPVSHLDLTAEVPAPGAFGTRLREAIQGSYATPEQRAGLDLRWLSPEAAAADPDHQERSFPARVQYLATLPGEISRRLLATLYVNVPVDELFVRAGDDWIPKAQTLWIAPRRVGRPEPPRAVELNGDPVVSPKANGLFELRGQDGNPPVVALGPGFALGRLATPEASPVFDLASYWLPVGSGDRRFAEVEALLLNALDPFGEIDHLPPDLVRERLSFGNPARPLPAEAEGALHDLWRVQALTGELATATAAGVDRLARRLLGPGEPLPALAAVPVRWRIEPGLSWMARTDHLAAVLGVTAAPPRDRLRQVAARAGSSAVAAWLAQTFDAVLAASDPNAIVVLINLWSFPGTETAQVAERRLALAQVVAGELREELEAVPLLAALAGIQNGQARAGLRAAAGERLQQRWTARLDATVHAALVALELSAADETLLLAPDSTAAFAEAHLEKVWPETVAVRPELPGRGLALVLGPEAQSLVHEKNPELAGDRNGLYGEIAGLGLLARRGKDDQDIATRPWRLVTGGVALIGPLGDRLFAPGAVGEDEWLRELLSVPLRPAFQQGVARADIEYQGQPMLAQSPLDHAYAAADYTDEPAESLPAAYSFQSLGGFKEELPELAAASRAPVLRYGDSFQFRAALVDQAGGLPVQIAREDEPWRLDPAKLVSLPDVAPPPQVIPYRRQVPVGEVNLLPALVPGSRKPEWPALPGDVSLRAREWWALDHTDAENVPVLLLSERSERKRFTGTLETYEVKLLPPAIDEHTLVRWAAPALDADSAASEAARRDLLTALTRLLTARQKPSDGNEERAVPLHDPAVPALGVRITAADARGSLSKIHTQVLPLLPVDPPSERPFERRPVFVRVTGGAFGALPTVSSAADRIVIVVPEGTFVAVEVWPLVPEADFASRFAAADVFAGLVDEASPFPGHVAFRPTVVLAEAATDELPRAADLYAGLSLAEQNGAVAVRFASRPEHLAFVDRFVLERERWVWRNRPLGTREAIANAAGDDERRRLAASGPPPEAFHADPAVRDNPAGPVGAWERLAAIDRGFVDRGELLDRWPRKAPDDPAHTGGSAGDVLLALDDREAVTAADYLRYGLRVRSRYAGVLSADRREATAVGAQTLRRLAVGFRGRKIKPPKILGVVPLTRRLDPDPLAATTAATPFLVLLDEIFFREYGVGERLDARLTLENLDFGEDPDQAKLPYRTGPMPDHWMQPSPLPDSPYFLGRQVTTHEDDDQPLRLDVFGPFGYSLDTSPAEALANASAFLVYPPAEVRPHWAMFARFRRVLDLPSHGETSEPSDAYALYTLPDTGLLATAAGDGPVLERTGVSTFIPRNLRLLLDPLAQPGGTAAPARNSEAASQYRYFLLISRILRGAGQALDVELPVGLWRVRTFDPNGGFPARGSFTVEILPGSPITAEPLGSSELEPNGEYQARVLEVLLNGRYDGLSRLDGALEWHDFWRNLLAVPQEDVGDAAGMIRRVSEAFVVKA